MLIFHPTISFECAELRAPLGFAQTVNELIDFTYFYAISCNRLVVWIWDLKLDASCVPNSYATTSSRKYLKRKDGGCLLMISGTKCRN